MSTTKDDIRKWLERGKAQGASHLLVICDTYDWDDYPVFASSEAEARVKASTPGPMQKLMEVYKIDGDWDAQLNMVRSHTY